MTGDTASTRRSRRSTSAVDKDNATVDLGGGLSLAENRKKAKSRSKSIGPGGLYALKAGSGNRRVSLAWSSRPPPRSILKPTMPLPEIPSFKSKRAPSDSANLSGMESLATSFHGDNSNSSGTKIALRTEEEQQSAAQEREERESAALKEEIKDRKVARRKSLANRRVSFAAEATLHTFHEIEYMQDSTTSTDSTRRASSAAGQSSALRREENTEDDTLDTTSTLPDQIKETVSQSLEDQGRAEQGRRRTRGSGATSAIDSEDLGEVTTASTVYDTDSDEGDDVAEVQTEVSGSDTDSDTDGTLMTVEAEEMTSASLASARSAGDDDETESSIDSALREAARRAVNQGWQPDESEEFIPGFVGWGKQARQRQQQATAARQDPVSDPSLPSSSPVKEVVDNIDTGIDMDMTNVVGGIIKPAMPSSPVDDVSVDLTYAPVGMLPQTFIAQDDQNSDDESLQNEKTMEFTTAVGGIRPNSPSDAASDHPSDEEMSMEMTTVMGGVLAAKNNQLHDFMRHSSSPMVNTGADEDQRMDVKTAIGHNLPPKENDDEHGNQNTPCRITQTPTKSKYRTAARKLMEGEANQLEITGNTDILTKSPSKHLKSNLSKSIEVSPGLAAFQGKGLRRSHGPHFSRDSSPPKSTISTPRRTRSQGSASSPRRPAPTKSPSPARRISRTPSPQRRSLPSKSASPQIRVTPQSNVIPNSSRTPKTLTNSLFQRNSTLPLVVLTPLRPKLTGVGIDRSGIGSPLVTQILNRRSSIGESAASFSPVPIPGQRKTVGFEDPRVMEEEVDRDRLEDQDRESGRSFLERESDGVQGEHEATMNLKELIQGLSPKKNPLRGRKSLHVGSARGLLGKHPPELEDDSDTEEQDGVKRLKGLQGSPVKNIRLQQPPSKAETTGSRATISRSGETDNDTIIPSTRQSPRGGVKHTTPKDQVRLREIYNDKPSTSLQSHASPSVSIAHLEPSGDDDRIHLQHLLDKSGIRFMELTTTKRRHTVRPSARKDSLTGEENEDISLEKCVVVGACTVPMLELYQHSCRELKKYISEGRRIVREIESETFEENPPLFREYMTASPEFKMLMDNQFKNVKTHARLLSKAMWYEWRIKLQAGLREGLLKTAESMNADAKVLDKQQKLLLTVLPAMTKHFEASAIECENLEAVARELEDCDAQELESARTELLAADQRVEANKREIADLREQLQAMEESISQLTSQKQACMAGIEEAEKIREACRGWSSVEIRGLQAKVEAIEKQHGWAIIGVRGTSVSMVYRREIELVIDSASFKSGQSNSCIDLRYIATAREHRPLPCAPEKDFCLQSIRDHVRSLGQSQARVSRLLKMVSTAWDRANALTNQVCQLNVTFPTLVARTSDSSIAIKSSLLLAPLQTKVEVVLGVQSSAGADGLYFHVSPHAAVVYGKQFNASKLVEFLSSRIGGRVYARSEQEKETEPWPAVVCDLHARLLARGKK